MWYLLGFSGTSAFVLWIFHEVVKDQISKIWKNATPKQVRIAFFGVMGVVLIFPNLVGFMFDTKKPQPDAANIEVPTSTNKSDLETYKEIGEGAVDLIQQAAAEKRRKDSIRIANRPKNWVVQIGEPYNKLKGVKQALAQLKDRNNVFVFKEGGKYRICWQDGNQDKEELEGEYDEIREELELGSSKLSVKDINKICPSKKSAVSIKDINNRKEGFTTPCKTCG